MSAAEHAARLRGKAILFLSLSTLGWGLSFPVFKAYQVCTEAILPTAGSLFVAAFSLLVRLGASWGGLAILQIRKPRPSALEWEQVLVTGCSGAAAMLLQMDGLSYTSASTSAFLTQFYCAILPLWAWYSHRKRPTPVSAVCTVLVLLGVAILSGIRPGSVSLGRGELETLLGACCFVVQILAMGSPRYIPNDPMKTGCWMFACKTLLVLPVAIATAPTGGFFPAAEVILSDVRAVALLGTLAVCCTAFNYMVIVVWQRYVTAVEAGIIYCAEPVYAALLALFLPGLISGLTGISYPNESIGWQLAVGGGLVTVANVWMGLYGERKNS